VLDAGHGARALSLIAEILGDEGKTASVAISGELLAESPRRTSGVKALVSLELSDAEQLPFPDSAFDSSTADSTLHHLAHPIMALQELVRVTRPGGWIVVSEPDWRSFKIFPCRKELAEAIIGRQCDSIRHVSIGPALESMFMAVGLSDLHPQTGTVKLREFLAACRLFCLDRAVKLAIECGDITSEEGQEWLDILRQASDAGLFAASMTGYTVAGRKAA